ncbi:replication initiator [Frankia sp. CiP3]|uniref:replication initiator n=1 Tax=Frankia sp. CiP3 TaxID=2880971 RepID=UPI001EF3F0AA|nr:replication initiator [Frankia sp. CiP3]
MTTLTLPADVRTASTDRITDGTFTALWSQITRIHGCARPIRLTGRIRHVDTATGEIKQVFDSASQPDGTILLPCGNRRASVCPSCSYLYAGDAWQIVHAGVDGGHDVPTTIAEHPGLFVTVTAPSFGPVHSQRRHHGRIRPCQQHPGHCRHGHPRCTRVHTDTDPLLGQAICPDCFDYPATVLWNATCSRLWKRTIDLTIRRLATVTGHRERTLRTLVRISYVKVAEGQHRGLIHFHAILRADAPTPPGSWEPPPGWLTVDTLAAAWNWAVAHARHPCPNPRRHTPTRPGGPHTPPVHTRWGEQNNTQRIAVTGGEITPKQVANYIPKYATKDITDSGVLHRRIRTLTELYTLLPTLTPHQARLVRTAWELGGWPDMAEHRLRENAHMFGYRGHWLTKSRRYSITFATCRERRRTWARTHTPTGEERTPLDAWGRDLNDDQVITLATWQFHSTGYARTGDQALADMAANHARSRREAARIDQQAA